MDTPPETRSHSKKKYILIGVAALLAVLATAFGFFIDGPFKDAIHSLGGSSKAIQEVHEAFNEEPWADATGYLIQSNSEAV